MFNRKLTTLTIIAALLSGYAMSATAADGTGNASATIVAPLRVQEQVGRELNFGSVSPDFDVATTVVIAPNGTGGTVTAPAAAGGETAGLIAGSGAREGQFNVTGADLAYDITLPAAPINISSGGFSMQVDTFTSNVATSAISGGTDAFYVGATLNVGANQNANGGIPYTGTYTVTVTYQ